MSLRKVVLNVLLAGIGLCAAGAPVQLYAQGPAEVARTESAGRSGAQTATADGGTWLSAGVGGGWTRVNCTICRADRYAGPSAALRFGVTLRPGLLVGAELDGWTRSNDDVRSMIMAGSATTYIYPDPGRGLFLKAGAGLVHYRLDPESGTNLFGLVLGAGYEFPVTDRLSITNSIGLIASSFGSLHSDDGTVAEDVSLSLLQVGFALKHR